MRKLLIIPFVIYVLLGASISFAQDSLKLLATIMGEDEWDDFTHCASAGDLNADGFMDIIVGAPGGSGGQGLIKIYFGSPDFDTIPEFRIVDGGNFGKSVACAGDVNKDGYSDIVVGAPSAYNYNSQSSMAGKAHIYFGGSPMDTVVDVILQDSDYYYMQGYCVSSAGDVNGDGYDDVLIAAPDDWAAAGRVFVYFGGEDMDSVYDVRIEGPPDSSENFGWSVAGIGDINSDGYDDVLIGRPYAGPPWGSGKASVYFGGNPMDTIPDIVIKGDINKFYRLGRNVASGGDYNGDGFYDILVSGAGRYTKVFYTVSSSPEVFLDTLNLFGEDILPSAFGWAISVASNINKDEFDDFMVADIDYGVDLKGKVYIFYGGAEVDSLWDITLTGRGNRKEHFGAKLAPAGDINGDGWNEVMVSSYYDSTLIGEVFIFTSNPTSVEEPHKKGHVNNFHLDQNFPNPFNAETIIEYVLPENSQIDLSVYNILGGHVRTLIHQYQGAGHKKTTWDGKDQAGREVSSGVYFYRLETDRFIEVKKMLLLR